MLRSNTDRYDKDRKESEKDVLSFVYWALLLIDELGLKSFRLCFITQREKVEKRKG